MPNDKEIPCDIVINKDKKLIVQAKETDEVLYNLKVKQDAIRDHSVRLMIIR
jgi:hypothetical protein